MKIVLELKILLEEMENKLKLCKDELQQCPPGELYQVVRGGKRTFFQATKDKQGRYKRKTITGDRQMVTLLARKVYLREEAAELEKAMKLVRQFLRQYQPVTAETILAGLPHRFQDLPKDWFFTSQNTQFRRSQETDADRWAKAPYRQSGYRPEGRTKITSRGLHVRSMAEVVCCERFYHHNLAFRYEAVVEIDGYAFAPDFTIMRRRDGKLFFWEHCGRPHDPEYMRRHKWKLEVYEKAGIVPWDNLIVTYGDRDGNVDVREIEAAILNRLV